MPYIVKERRTPINLGDIPQNSGELNYKITCMLIDYYYAHGKRYLQINDVLGALEGAKLEFYRRVAAPYEDEKIKENGDVYE